MNRQRAFTPLEKSINFNQGRLSIKTDGGFQPETDPPLAEMPPSAQTVREQSSLTGFTLIEFIIAASTSIIVLSTLLLALNYTRNSIEMLQVNLGLQEEIQNALDIMASDLRQGSAYKISAGPVNADNTWYNSITFAVPFDIDGDGDIINPSAAIEWSNQNPANWSVTYLVSGNQLRRNAGDGRNPVLANHITSLAFRRSALNPLIMEIAVTARKTTFSNQAIEISLLYKLKMRN